MGKINESDKIMSKTIEKKENREIYFINLNIGT